MASAVLCPSAHDHSHSRRRRHHVDTSHATPVPKNRAPLGRGRAAPQAKLKTARAAGGKKSGFCRGLATLMTTEGQDGRTIVPDKAHRRDDPGTGDGDSGTRRPRPRELSSLSPPGRSSLAPSTVVSIIVVGSKPSPPPSVVPGRSSRSPGLQVHDAGVHTDGAVRQDRAASASHCYHRVRSVARRANVLDDGIEIIAAEHTEMEKKKKGEIRTGVTHA